MFSVAFKWTGPKTTSTARLRGKFLNAAKWTTRYMLKLLIEYVSVFENIEPEFEEKFYYRGGNVEAYVQLKDGEAGGGPVYDVNTGQPRDITANQVFMYLDQGTRVRHAVLGEKFIPKTTKHSRFSQPGTDDVRAVNSNINEPGLEHRDVFDLIGEEGQKEIERRVDQIIRDLQRGII